MKPVTKVKKGDRVRGVNNTSALIANEWGTVSHIDPEGFFLISWDNQYLAVKGVRWYDDEVGRLLTLYPKEISKEGERSTSVADLSPVCTKCQTVYPDANHTENFVCWSCKKYPFYQSTSDDD